MAERQLTGLAAALTRLIELTDFKAGPAVTSRLAKVVALHTRLTGEASHRKAAAEDAVAQARKKQAADDVIAVLDSLGGRSPK